MTQRETFTEFAERVKPKSGQKFKDNRGNEWEFDSYCNGFKTKLCGVLVGENNSGNILTHDFIEPMKPKMLAPAIYRTSASNVYLLTDELYSCEQEAKVDNGDYFIKWPAIPNAQGFYEVQE